MQVVTFRCMNLCGILTYCSKRPRGGCGGCGCYSCGCRFDGRGCGCGCGCDCWLRLQLQLWLQFLLAVVFAFVGAVAVAAVISLLVAVLVAGGLVSCSSHQRAGQPGCVKLANERTATLLLPRLSPTSERAALKRAEQRFSPALLASERLPLQLEQP